MKPNDINTALTRQTRYIPNTPLQLSDSSSIPLISARNMGRSCCNKPRVRTRPRQMTSSFCYMLAMLGASAAAVYLISLNFSQSSPFVPPAPPLPSPSPSSSLPGNHSNSSFGPSPSSSYPGNHSNSSFGPSPSSSYPGNHSNSSSGPSPSSFSPSSSSPYPPETATSQLVSIFLIMGIGLADLAIICNVLRLGQLLIRQNNHDALYQQEGICFEALNNILLHEHSNETLMSFIEEIRQEYKSSCACECRCHSPSSRNLYNQLRDTHDDSDIIPAMNAITRYCYEKGNQGKKLFLAINAAANTIQAGVSPFAAP